MRTNQSYIWIVLIVSFTIPITIHAQALSLKIELDKQEFVEGEPIYSVATLENMSDQVQNCARFNLEFNWLKYTVIGSDSVPLAYSGMISSAVPLPFIPLEPHASKQRIISLMTHYYNCFNRDAGHPIDIAARMLPGTYQVQAHYHNDSISVASNTLMFTVVAARGDEAIVLDLLKPKFTSSNLSAENCEENTTFFQDLADKYPRSNFYPLMRRILASCLSSKGDTVQARMIRKDLIKKYPNTGLAMEVFQWLGLKGREKEEYLEELNRIAPNNRVVKYWQDSTLK